MDYDLNDQWCRDCQMDKDNCPDCCEGDLYISPDAYERHYDR